MGFFGSSFLSIGGQIISQLLQRKSRAETIKENAAAAGAVLGATLTAKHLYDAFTKSNSSENNQKQS